MNILIVKMSAIGDVIHTLPALNAIRGHYPDAHITWLVEEAAADLVADHEALDRVLISKRKQWVKGLLSSSCLDSLKEVYRFVRQLRDTEYDLILDFQALLKSGIMIALSRGKRKIGFDRGMEHMEYSYLFLNERIATVDMENHALLRGMMLLKALGIESSEIVFNLPIQDSDRNVAQDLLARESVEEPGLLIAIHPVAKWETKLWSNEKFARLADKLIEQCGARVVFTGGREDKETVDDIISRMKGEAANLAGATTLKTLAAIYERSDLVISTDTGPMHLAAAAGTPVAALFGPTAPWRTGQFGPGHEIIMAGLECSPCFKRTCDTVECMESISVENAFGSVEAILKRLKP